MSYKLVKISRQSPEYQSGSYLWTWEEDQNRENRETKQSIEEEADKNREERVVGWEGRGKKKKKNKLES